MSSQACHWLAGLEAGVWAGLAMLGWFALTAAWAHHSVWVVPNRLGALWYHEAGWRGGWHAATWAGLAFHLLVSGVVGILFGCLVREARNRVRVSLWGLLSGLVWCYLSYALFWRRLLGALAGGPPPSLLAAYLVFGLALGCYPGRLRSAQRHFLGELPPPAGTEASSEGPPAA
jgi:hypothetical protein